MKPCEKGVFFEMGTIMCYPLWIGSDATGAESLSPLHHVMFVYEYLDI